MTLNNSEKPLVHGILGQPSYLRGLQQNVVIWPFDGSQTGTSYREREREKRERERERERERATYT